MFFFLKETRNIHPILVFFPPKRPVHSYVCILYVYRRHQEKTTRPSIILRRCYQTARKRRATKYRAIIAKTRSCYLCLVLIFQNRGFEKYPFAILRKKAALLDRSMLTNRSFKFFFSSTVNSDSRSYIQHIHSTVQCPISFPFLAVNRRLSQHPQSRLQQPSLLTQSSISSSRRYKAGLLFTEM